MTEPASIVVRDIKAWCCVCGQLPPDTFCEHIYASAERSRLSAERQAGTNRPSTPEQPRSKGQP